MAELKQLARQIFQETLAAIDIPEAMRRKLQRKSTRVRCGEMSVDLAAYREIHVMAIGKAAHAMVEGLASVLAPDLDRKSTRLNSSHVRISYAVFCLKKKNDDELIPAAI